MPRSWLKLWCCDFHRPDGLGRHTRGERRSAAGAERLLGVQLLCGPRGLGMVCISISTHVAYADANAIASSELYQHLEPFGLREKTQRRAFIFGQRPAGIRDDLDSCFACFDDTYCYLTRFLAKYSGYTQIHIFT